MNKIRSEILVLLVLVFSFINFNCGSSSNAGKEQNINIKEKPGNITKAPKFFYSCIYLDKPGSNSGIWYVNSKDSIKKLILKLPTNYGITADNFKLSPTDKYLAFYVYDSASKKTNVYSLNLENLDLSWLKSDRGFNGVNLVWKNDSFLYCNLNSGGKDTYAREKYTALIDVGKNKSIKTFTPERGNRLAGYIDNKYLLYEFDPGGSIYKSKYYLIDERNNDIIRTFEDSNNPHGLEHFEISPSGTEFFHIHYKVYAENNGKTSTDEELLIQKIRGSSGELIMHSLSGISNVQWSPDGKVISFLKVGSINHNEATKEYTKIYYLYFYNVASKEMTNLETYQAETQEGEKTGFDIPKTLPVDAVIFNYLDYDWSPSGKYLFIKRQDLSMNSSNYNCILYDNESKSERVLIKNYKDSAGIAGWWEDNSLLLKEDSKYKLDDLQNNKSESIPVNGIIIYLKKEE